MKVIGIQRAKPVVEDALTHENKEKQVQIRRIYALTDGTNSTTDIGEEVGLHRTTVGHWQKKWAQQGLLSRQDEQSPWSHVVTLEQVGLDEEMG